MAKKDKVTRLTDREKLFILEYCKDLNATQAAIRAWYSEKTATKIASENLTKLDIVEALAKELKKKFAKVEKNGDRVIKCLVELTERCMQKKPVMRYNKKLKEMEQVTEEDENWVMQWVRTFDSAGANSALEKLGKYHKLFTEKHEHTWKDWWAIQIEVKHDYDWMTAKQIQEEIKKEMGL